MDKQRVILAVIDGMGIAPPSEFNAVTSANTPNLDALWRMFPHGGLQASGTKVGLPKNTPGSSLSGMMTIGAGRVEVQPNTENILNDVVFKQHPLLEHLVNLTQNRNRNLHILTVLSEDSAIGNYDLLRETLIQLRKKNIHSERVVIHGVLDGVESGNYDAYDSLRKVESICAEERMGRVRSLIGRDFACDTNKRWSRTRQAYELLVHGKGNVVFSQNVHKFLKKQEKKKHNDSNMPPISLISSETELPATVSSGDAVLFLSLSEQHSDQLLSSMRDNSFVHFPTKILPATEIYSLVGAHKNSFYHINPLSHTLGQVIEKYKLKQARIAEPEKYPYASYYFDGRNYPLQGTHYVELPGRAEGLIQPQLSMPQQTQIVIGKATQGVNFISTIYAGPDLLGHNENIDATIKSMEVVDAQIGKLAEFATKNDYLLVVTSDHGHCEDMQNHSKDDHHTLNDVPVLFIHRHLNTKELPLGTLADIAPTILDWMELEKPSVMSGTNLLAV